MILEFWESIVNKLNAEKKCNLCWNFVGAGRSDYFNTLKIDDKNECCVYVGLLKFGSKLIIEQSDFGSLTKAIDYNFEIIAGTPSRLDIQFYNENPQINIMESKYIKYIKPIQDCLGFGLKLDCDFQEYEVVEWRTENLLNFQDFNIDGIKIFGTIRKNA